MIRVSTSQLYQNSNQSVNADQVAMMTTQAELASGKQVNSPSDNPVGAAQASLLQSNETQITQYGANQSQASLMLNNASSQLSQAINILQSVNSSLVEAGGGTLNATQKQSIATQLQQQLSELVGLANSTDGQGGYLFGGSVNNTQPFTQSGNQVTYVGDSLSTSVQISQTRTEQMKYPGSSVFMQIPTGNGSFSTAVGSTNTGSGAISAGSVVTPGALTGDHYVVTFGAGGGSYSVLDSNTGSTVVNNATYTAGSPITVAGMQFSISGTPAAGDTFTLAPSTNQSIFSVLSSAISALQNAGSATTAQNAASLATALNGVSSSLDSLSTTQASMGTQIAELSAYGNIDSAQTLQDQTQMSAIVDMNYATGVSQLQQQQTQFQAALQSYAAISKLSLFNYI
jgi:flagellar hook-associated protein 3 FlgL